MNSPKIQSIALPLLVLLLVSACSSSVPRPVREPIAGAPYVQQAQGRIEQYIGSRVRWGGVILDTENKSGSSRLTIMAFPLDSDGEPRSNDLSSGRFIAVIDHFLEPKVYAPERAITVTGTISGSETIKVGDYPYEYPMVAVEHYYLWPLRQEPAYNNYPPYWWYDPFYPWPYPYYPYYPHRHLPPR